MDYVWFALMLIVLGAASWLLSRADKKTKNKYKLEAYKLLDAPDATPADIKKTLKMLRLYGGRFRKDKEFLQLSDKLITKLDQLEPRPPYKL